MLQSLSFGEFICQKRKAQGITQKNIADALGVTTVYICDIEKSRRYPPTKGNMLDQLSMILNLDKDELFEFYDLAGREKGCISPDLLDYIMSSEIIRSALRVAKLKASTDDWQQFINNLSNK